MQSDLIWLIQLSIKLSSSHKSQIIKTSFVLVAGNDNHTCLQDINGLNFL